MGFAVMHVAAGHNDGKKLADRRRQYLLHLVPGCPCHQGQVKFVFMQFFEKGAGTVNEPRPDDFFEIGLLFSQDSMGLPAIDRPTVLGEELMDAVYAWLAFPGINIIMGYPQAHFLQNGPPRAIMIRHGVGNDAIHIKNDGMDFQV